MASQQQYFVGVIEGYYGMPWKFDQRKDLFCRMSKMGLNTYIYAPKNDLKHRSHWKEHYDTTELSLLSSIIDSAKKNGLIFVYALSPGQTIRYSSDDDINMLKSKLKQLATVGCECFALLFDDIPRNFSSNEDLRKFQSIAKAQCHLTNETYAYLNKPKFMFCPTEYCDAFSYPNVMSSAYLKTIGEDLDENIHIMWTGEQVVSKIISQSRLQEIVNVLKRKPVIWDNLHANDYDSSQLYLGPFSGRSVDLISCTSGMLSNPNCQLELNFVPFHTLGSWYKAALLYSDSCSKNDAFVLNEDDFYAPRKALEGAVEEWKESFILSSSCETNDNGDASISKPFIATQELITIVDLFYLPYEVGTTAKLLLEEFSLPCKAWWNPLINGSMLYEESMPNFKSCLTLITKVQSDLLKSMNQSLAIEILPFLTNLLNVLKLAQKYLNHLKIHGHDKPLNLTSILPFKEDLSIKLYSMLPFVMSNCQSVVKEPDFYAIRPCMKEELSSLIQFKNEVFREEIGNVENNIESHPELAYVLEANNKVIGFCGACFQMSKPETSCGENTPSQSQSFNEFVGGVCKTYDSQLFFSFSNVQHKNFISKLINVVLDILKCRKTKGVFTVFSESDPIRFIVCDVGFKLIEAHDGKYIYALKLS